MPRDSRLVTATAAAFFFFSPLSPHNSWADHHVSVVRVLFKSTRRKSCLERDNCRPFLFRDVSHTFWRTKRRTNHHWFHASSVTPSYSFFLLHRRHGTCARAFPFFCVLPDPRPIRRNERRVRTERRIPLRASAPLLLPQRRIPQLSRAESVLRPSVSPSVPPLPGPLHDRPLILGPSDERARISEETGNKSE